MYFVFQMFSVVFSRCLDNGLAALKCCLDETEEVTDAELWGLLNSVFTMDSSSKGFIDKLLCHFLTWFARHSPDCLQGFLLSSSISEICNGSIAGWQDHTLSQPGYCLNAWMELHGGTWISGSAVCG